MSALLENPRCPFLPIPEERMSAAAMRGPGSSRGEEFYATALLYAHSLWLEGLPARAILLLNRALGSAIDGTEERVREWPPPYRAMVWILENHREEQFIGNPRRHWQHLATRMVEPRRELRTWRAWACWLFARRVLPDCPADEKQIAEEGVREPSEEEIAARLTELGIPGEADLWREALQTCRPRPWKAEGNAV